MTQEHTSSIDPVLSEIASKAGPTAESTRQLLEDETVRQLPPNNQGSYIVDRFVGNVAAAWSRGKLSSDQTAVEVLHGVASAVSNSPDLASWKQNIGTVVRADGIRVAVELMTKDRRTGTFLERIDNAIAETPQGPALRTVAQLEGYVYGLSGNEYRGWHDTVLNEVNRYIQLDYDRPNAHWDNETAKNLLSSDVPSIRTAQRAWDQAMTEAAKDGMDVGLLARSAEMIRTNRHIAGGIGHGAIRAAAPQPNYDTFFS